MSYSELLKGKISHPILSGFAVEDRDISNRLFDYQKFIVKRALMHGKYAVFADCGLGKTIIELEYAKMVSEYTNGAVFILAPFAVVGQIYEDMAPKFDYSISIWEPGDELVKGVYITNYEQLDSVPFGDISGLILDESSILKNAEGAIRNAIIEKAKQIPYKLALTATPAPNDPMELGNHSEFLDVMNRNEMLAMYFVHDGGNTTSWRLKGHSVRSFYQWVSSWAIMLGIPSDIGFSDDGYLLPELNYFEKTITTPKKENGMLFNAAAVSATDYHGELRVTQFERIEQVAEIVNKCSDQFIIWIEQDTEGAELRKLIPGSIEVKGSDAPNLKKDRLLAFGRSEFRVIITKTKIASFGLNWQQCHNQVFASPNFSFEKMYQGIRRSWRFGQINPVNVWLITTDTMMNVVESLKIKQYQHQQMRQGMQSAMKEIFSKKEIMPRQFKELKTEHAIIQLGDCVELIKNIPDDSIGISVFSPPFKDLYVYSDQLEDMGNCRTDDEFYQSMKYMVMELHRIMWSGRNVIVHCMDLPIQKGKEGFIGLKDFSGQLIKMFSECGFIYHSRVTIWKDPVVEMQRTKALGLLHKQVKKDASMSRVGIPDYLLVFRKPGEHAHPVKCDIPVDLWQKYASPIWYDIKYGNTLNGRDARADNDERHICPLQLDTIERAIHLWSNEGDTLYTPFMGIGSEVFQALKMGRNAIGNELKESYFDIACKNINAAETSKLQSEISFF
jgi:hypothetical protein